MKFTVAGSRIICSRPDNTVEEEDFHRRVVEFDSHVDSVPPHVTARLTQGEIEELEHFLADRKRIRANPTEIDMLEALPVLLREARETLDSVDRINEAMYRQLDTSISEMRVALENVRPAPKGSPTRVKKMHDSEVQKKRLEDIKQGL